MTKFHSVETPSDISTFCHAQKPFHWYSHKARFVELAGYRVFGLPVRKFIFQIAPNGDTAMARFNQSVFASISLTSQDKKAFEDWLAKSKASPLETAEYLIGLGFKISISFVVDQSAFCLSLIGTDSTKQHNGMVMTSWSDDLNEVIMIAAYKHCVMCNEGPWPTRDNSQRWG